MTLPRSGPVLFFLLGAGALAAPGRPAWGQPRPDRMEVGPEIFGREEDKDSDKKEKAPRPPAVLPFARALYEALAPGDWTAMGLSTSTPREELTRFLRGGYYRLELVSLSLMARKAKRPLEELLKRREDGHPLRDIAKLLKLEYPPLYDEALGLKTDLEKDARKYEVRESTAPVSGEDAP